MSGRPIIRAFFDEPTNTVSYLVADPATKKAAVIDPVLDYDHNAGRGRHALGRGRCSRRPTRPATRIEWALETHAHADHLLGCALHQGQDRRQDRHRRAHQGRAAHLPADLQRRRTSRPTAATSTTCSRTASASRSASSTSRCSTRPGTRRPTSPTRSRTRCSSATRCSCRTTAPRGPTSRAATRTSSTARSDGCWRCRPRRGCSCATTTRRPAATPTPGKPPSARQRAKNVHVKEGVTEDEFVAMREARDAELSAPRLLLPSIQVNIRAGRFPPAEANGVRYLTIPVKLKGGAGAAV